MEDYEKQYEPKTAAGHRLAKVFYQQDISKKIVARRKENLSKKVISRATHPPSINQFLGAKRSAGFKRRESSLLNLSKLQHNLSKLGRR